MQFHLFKNSSRFSLYTAIVLTLVYFSIPLIANYIVHQPSVLLKYASNDAQVITATLQKNLLYPFGAGLSSWGRGLLVFPYYLVLISGLHWIYQKTQKWWKYGFGLLAAWIGLVYCFPNSLLWFEKNTESSIEGNRYEGNLKNAKRIHFEGKNYATYSFLGYFFGRTYVHSKVRKTIEETYQLCETTCPKKYFILGETGLKNGGRFLPHRSHQAGLSVDFMTPLLDEQGKPYLGYNISSLWGYTWEFDKQGKLNNWTMDFETMARHLLALEKTAQKNGLHIEKIIFDPDLLPELFATPSGNLLQQLPFMTHQAIWRHDEHYHVDFGL